MMGQTEFVEGVLPPQFVTSTLPRIGGFTRRITYDGTETAVGYGLFSGTDRGDKTYIIRGHRLGRPDRIALPDTWLDVSEFRHGRFAGTQIKSYKEFAIVTPSSEQAREAESLQKAVWGRNITPYPFDLYRIGSGAHTRLTAVDSGGHTIGFLLGFFGYGDKWMGDNKGKSTRGIWTESQIAAVDRHARHKGVARALKWAQYDDAITRHLSLIHWTVDPLQMNNAGLNYGLGAIASDFTRNYYSFRNENNRVTASRFGVSWIVGGTRAESARQNSIPQQSFSRLANKDHTELIHPLRFPVESDWKPTGDRLLIEIPRDWNVIQQTNIKQAEDWRKRSDDIFQRAIGVRTDGYVVTGRVIDGDTPYIVAEPFTSTII